VWLVGSRCSLATGCIFLVKEGVRRLFNRRWKRAAPAAGFLLDLLIPTQLLGVAAGVGMMALQMLGEL
jgi:hypothetical protein